MSEKPKNQLVKLYLYHEEGKKTTIDKFETESFDDFLLVTGNFRKMQQEEIQEFLQTLNENTDQTVVMIDRRADIQFYGFREEEEDES